MIDTAADDLARHMWEARVAYLSALFDRCRRRFVEAARLVGVELAQWPNLTVVGVRTGVDVFDLLPFWDELCRRYRAERAEAQNALFENNPSAAEAFSRWVYWEVWPLIAMDGGVVCAVLRATGALPADDRATAGYYLVGHVRGMSIAPKFVALDPENLDFL